MNNFKKTLNQSIFILVGSAALAAFSFFPTTVIAAKSQLSKKASATDGITGAELARSVESISLGTARDEALMNGLRRVQTSDVASVIACIRLAYNQKFNVGLGLLAKTPNLSAMDLALVAKECVSDYTRDQILLQGISFVISANADGVSKMVAQSAAEKMKVTFAGLSKMNNPSASDFGAILKSINDDNLRDKIINGGIPLLLKFDGDGAAAIVERSSETKVSTAIKLLSLIPQVSGTDLDKILVVCGSGIIRDSILTEGLKILKKITKKEAKSLIRRSYSMSDSTAIAMINIIEEIDGATIGEIALMSKRASRDLIIEEGMKLLKSVDVAGLISMIKASDKILEKLVMETSLQIKNMTCDNATEIADAISKAQLKDKFLIKSIDWVVNLDERGLTSIAMAAISQSAKEQIVIKGTEKMGDL